MQLRIMGHLSFSSLVFPGLQQQWKKKKKKALLPL